MIGFREPGYLWQVSKESGIPFVWGPVDAKGKFPMAYSEGASFRNKAFLYVKNFITELQLRYGRRVNNAVRQSKIILSANSNSVTTLKKYFNVESILMNETGCSLCDDSNDDVRNRVMLSAKGVDANKSSLNLLWIGKFDFRKQLSLALRIIGELKHLNVILHIVGTGNMQSYKETIRRLNIEKKVVWHGLMSHSDVQKLMRETDALLFTSVAEGTPHVVLEAISNRMPIICFDTCGQGDCVDSSVGIKIPLSNPSQSVKEFAEQIVYLYNHPEELQRMSENCKKRAEGLSWDNKAIQIVKLYEGIL